MLSTTEIITLCAGYSFAGLLMHYMDHGMNVKLQLIFLSIPVAAIICFALFDVKVTYKQLNYGFLSTPIVVVALHNLLNLLSWKLHHRELRLRMRGARNMQYAGTGDPYKKYKLSDTFFSFLLIITWICWPVIYLLIMKALFAWLLPVTETCLLQLR